MGLDRAQTNAHSRGGVHVVFPPSLGGWECWCGRGPAPKASQGPAFSGPSSAQRLPRGCGSPQPRQCAADRLLASGREAGPP